ncbi:putative D-isomer specific 2-hydroxyacid dehydrogenase [Rosellinia necatrix]|uniref:Putative D-isomer specific 2-hydroxyacid dehydrogenase n=1 Tax=Rosellinia necatrix TaxID=77044 RepID=A0A1S7UNR8_ROSNE|nr:putative D-isomer specific 2-hydroxyacid dehydrogenase [Rosellinia necatrix]
MGKPIVLHLGDDIRWNHDAYAEFKSKFDIRRSYSMNRDDFKAALRSKKFGDFVAMYRPFWNTGGEMGNWDEELISLLPDSCRIFASAGAGFDWVDTKAMAKKGVIYCNAAAACTESVADVALYFIISTFRHLPWSAIAARSAAPDQFVDANRNLASISQNPSGHTLGIIGYGRIGRRIAEKAYRALDMKIMYNDIVRMPPDIEAETEAVYEKDLEGLLGKADCVVVATPFAGDKLLSAPLFRKFKPGSRIINIARGKLIDEAALIDALKSGHIAAAGLDVHEYEPQVNPELAAMKNVELLSHNAGASVGSHVGFEAMGMQNIVSYFETGKAISPVNLQFLDESKGRTSRL